MLSLALLIPRFGNMLREITTVKVPEYRQRKEFGNIDELAASMDEHGQIEPIVVDMTGCLIAGERRLRAAKQLGWSHIEVHEINPLDDFHKHALELEENLRRKDLTPAERVRALAEYHRLQQRLHGAARQHVGGGHGINQTAENLGVSKSTVSSYLEIDAILDVAPHLATSDSISGIVRAWRQERLRAVEAEIARRAVKAGLGNMDCIRHQDALEFLATLPNESVDLFLIDVPFGINLFETFDASQSSLGTQWYDDPDKVAHFCFDMTQQIARILAPGRHALIFCAWGETFTFYNASKNTDLTFELPPYVWDRVHATPAMQPCHQADKVYENIVHFYRGTPVWPKRIGKNIMSWGRTNTPVYPTQKPGPFIRKLIEQFTFEGQLVVDCCMGSGETILQAMACRRRVLGCDINETSVNLVRTRLIQELPDMLSEYVGKHVSEEPNDDTDVAGGDSHTDD